VVANGHRPVKVAVRYPPVAPVGATPVSDARRAPPADAGAPGTTRGSNAAIVCGTPVGEWVFIAAGAVVTKDAPANALMAGVPAQQIGWACVTRRFGGACQLSCGGQAVVVRGGQDWTTKGRS
jgi:hypothetical protein